MTFETFEPELHRLVASFTRQFADLTGPGYAEAQLRDDFLNPLFRALGWDLENKAGHIQNDREVEIESRTDIAGKAKRADYLFRTDGTNRFVCEAKKPRETLGPKHAFQAKRYAWNKALPLAVLSDFEEIKIYVVGGKPHLDRPDEGLWKRWHFSEFPAVAREIWDLLSRPAVAAGSIDALLDSLPKRPSTGRGKARQLYLIKPDRTRALDTEFLGFLDEARRSLGSDLVKHNPEGDIRDVARLTEAVQHILDRLLFLRICEDRDIDTGTRLDSIVQTWQRNYGREDTKRYRQTVLLEGDASGKTSAGRTEDAPPESLWYAIVRHFRALDRRPASHVPFFNGQLFKHHFTEDLIVGDQWLADFIGELSDEESPYLFNVIEVEILGNVYERFLGKTVRPHGRGVTIEEKPEVRKAGGVYYTPRYIVDYIVEQTVGRLLTPILEVRTFAAFEKQTAALRLLDPACGSGSFLLRTFERVCEHWQRRLTRVPAERRPELCWVDPATGDVHLSIDLKRRILRDNIYGVDIDAQAVEVTQLSLYLKMLENENRITLQRQRELFAKDTALLPSLEHNIKCGNSLIASDFSLDPDDLVRVNAFDWPVQFKNIMKGGGFDAVVGNPPYGAYLDDSHKDYLNSRYSFQSYQLDSYLLFLERSLRDLLRKGGLYGMIIPNPWLTNVMQTTTRRFVCEHCRIHEIVHFKFSVFPEVTVDTQIVVLEKGEPETWIANVRVVQSSKTSGAALLTLPNVVLAHAQDKWRLLNGGVLNIFTSAAEEALAAKIVMQSSRLDVFCNINVGIKPYQVGKGVPKQTRKDVQTRPFDSDNMASERHRPYLRGSDIGRYIIAPIASRFLEYGPWLAEHRPAANFDAPQKLVMRQTGDSIVATCDEQQFLCLNNMHVIVPKGEVPSLKYILGIINSSVLNWYYHTLNPEVGEALAEVKRTNVAQLPLRIGNLNAPADKSRHDKLVALVDKMLSLTPQLRNATDDKERRVLQNAVTATDHQIDELVYELYGLTPEEIALVEGAAEG